MEKQKEKLILGSLLHDIGKIVYRAQEEKKTHSQLGYEYLKNSIGLKENEILDCVRYHHAAALKSADISEDSFAYIVYLADNIASAADRREKDSENVFGFDKRIPLQPVFNILNGNGNHFNYSPSDMQNGGKINYPIPEKKEFEDWQYQKILANFTENLKGLEWSSEYVNSLLEVMEANLAFVPSSTASGEVPDISLFDHVKLTAAIANCIYDYLEAKENRNYKQVLFQNGKKFFDEPAFLMFSMDISGIQNFIYTISTKNALRTLRARSFYLEIMMEHIIDCLLEQLQLSRVNLVYSGGGHCYILLPNTDIVKSQIREFLDVVNQWFIEKFRISLYIAGGVSVCCGNSLQNNPEGSYSAIFENMSRDISGKKANRYSATEIIYLNQQKSTDYSRECKVCKKSGVTDRDGVCPTCRAIKELSQKVLYEDFFSILHGEYEDELPLPGGYTMVADSQESLVRRIQKDTNFVRAYNKNRMYMGKQIASKIWVGNYTTGNTFEEFAEQAKGIKRIGILRADVDNLGHAFVSGFRNPKNHDRYVTLSRTATLSRQLSLFFKYYINDILSHPVYTLDGHKKEKRYATIVYSGGDDLFIAGAWDDMIELAVDIHNSFQKYTEGTLTISAGIGIYQPSYPISVIAEEVAGMEDKSKRLEGKNAVTLLEDGCVHDGVSDGTYAWSEFQEEVLHEKFRQIYLFFESDEDHGKVFLYNMLELIRNQQEKINLARFVYLLSRMEPDQEEKEKRIQYQNFSAQMCKWIRSPKDCRQLKTAITLYAYYTREKEEV